MGDGMMPQDTKRTLTKKSNIGLVAALSIGVGGMIGAGIFSILGVVASISGPAMPCRLICRCSAI